MEYNNVTNELLVLGQDRMIKYWSLTTKELSRKLKADEDA
jgi:hypothetical protein